MLSRLLGRIFILITIYLFLCALIFSISYISLTKNKFIDLPGFRAIQKNLYWELFVKTWQNKSDCVTFDKDLIYVPKIGSCKHENAEFKTVLNFTRNGRLMPQIVNENFKPILILGDSHAMGWGVNDDETFSYILQNLLKIPVYNLAVSSYGTVREVIRLEKSELLENSEIIIIQYHETDLKENKHFHELKKEEYANVFTNMTGLEKNTYKIIKKIVRRYKSSLRLIFLDITGALNRKIKTLDFEPHYEPLVVNLKKIKNFEQKKIIVFYSSSPTLRFYNFPKGFDKNFPNIYFYDFYNDGFGESSYYYLDRHPNKKGHQEIAKALDKILRSSFLNK